MYLISVYFDHKTNHTLQNYINRIAAKTGNTFMTDNQVPPHMTISAIEAKSADILKPGFNSLRGKIKQGMVSFVSVGELLPHVTMGKQLDKGQMVKALEVMQECFVPFEATVTEIGLAKVNPHEDVERFVLGGPKTYE